MKHNIRWNVEDMTEQQKAALKDSEAIQAPKPPRKSKYNAIKTVVDGITFDSKKEARIYGELKLRPDVKFILRQVSFPLPGGFKHRVDFMLYYKDGRVTFCEAKGYKHRIGEMKRKQVEELYGITIEVR